jgi:hypothetical protein
MGREEEIKVIAYTIWQAEGCHHGHSCDHWYQAEAIWVADQKADRKKPEAAPDVTGPSQEVDKAQKAIKKTAKQSKAKGKKS